MIGIVTVLYNSESVLDDFFDSLENQTYKDFVVYAIDNKSTDDSVKKTKELISKSTVKCKLIENDKNLGVAAGNNIGIKAALNDKCDYVLLANNDIVMANDTISNLLDGLEEQDADMAVPKILFWKTGRIWMAGGKFRWLQGTTLHYGFNQPDNEEYHHPKRITYAPTCFMLIKASVFKKVGIMDERYFVYFDDTDFLWRCKENGIKLFYIPSSCMKHKVSVSTGGSQSDFSIRYTCRNQIFFIKKSFSKFHQIMSLAYVFLRFNLKLKRHNNAHVNKLMAESYKEGFRMYRDYNHGKSLN